MSSNDNANDNKPKPVVISQRPLRRLLMALLGQPHEIRELQHTRGPDNPIDIVLKEFNDQMDN